MWDNPWVVTDFAGGQANFAGDYTKRQYLQTVATNFNTIDITGTATLTPQIGQWSTDLKIWHDIGPIQVNDNGAEPGDMEIQIPLTNADQGRLFGRLYVTQP